jgi:hypothetical protein
MSKKDLNYIKFVKPQVREAERRMQGKGHNRTVTQKLAELNVACHMEPKENEVCKEAAKMGARERLMNYAATGDGTYLGVGCKWDLLTQWGRDKFGRLL